MAGGQPTAGDYYQRGVRLVLLSMLMVFGGYMIVAR
jgi:hypothetical protein